MTTLILEPTITAQWLGLIKEAESWSQHNLSEELESYLVFLLIRFMEKPELAESVLAIDYLQAFDSPVRQSIKLQDVGDKCLLLAGLFPERAERRRVRISYFVELGQGAYSMVADLSKVETAKFYHSLGHSFVALMDILHAARELAGNQLTPLQAIHLWNDVKSPHALKVFKQYSTSFPVNFATDSKEVH